MAFHSRLSASKTKEWAMCAGIVPMAEFYPKEDTPNDAARLGTCVHALIERCLGEGTRPGMYQDRVMVILHEGEDNEGVSILQPGRKLPTKPGSIAFIIDEDMVTAATSFCDYVVNRLTELFPNVYTKADYRNAKRAVEKGHLKLESRTNPLPERDDTGGTADVTLDAWPVELEVADYKNGTGVYVPVEKNWQLRSYTLGRAEESGFDYDRYRYTIGQPRHHRAPPSGVSSETCTGDELREFQDTLREAALRVDKARLVLHEFFIEEGADVGGAVPDQEIALLRLDSEGLLYASDDGQCDWCPRRTDCPAAARVAAEALQADFAEDAPPANSSEIAKKASEMPSEQLVQLLNWSDYIEGLLKAVRRRAEKLLQNGAEVEGWKMVMKSANRTLKDMPQDEMLEKLETEWGLPKDKVLIPQEPKLLTGPQMEKLIPKADRAAFSEAFMYKPEGGPVMVRASDKRPAWSPTAAADDFEDDAGNDEG